MLIAAENISKSYSEKALIHGSSFYFSEGSKIGVIGKNGAGKSTLLKIMAGFEEPDAGTVSRQKAIRIGYLPQNPVMDPEATVIEQVLGSGSEPQNEMREYEAKTILNILGIKDFTAKIGTLSGGQKKRMAMAGALALPCDALILDEPTNHLDNDMILWLENRLIRFTGGILMVTHDRYFLDRVVSKILEVENGSFYLYEANYSKYLELKALREEVQAGAERKRQSLLRKELEWIQRGVRARGTKSKSRIERFEELSERSDPDNQPRMEINSVASRLGKKTVELEAISKSYGGRVIVRDFSCNLARDARIGVVGRNGCGKSTLLGLISGQIQPDSGQVVTGDTVKLGYFSQEWVDMDLSVRVIDCLKNIAPYIETIDGTLTAAQLLEKFLFPPDLQWNTVGKLSGGEQRRLFLLSVIMGAPNILLLDEPTNDLDIETILILEDYIESFRGAVVVVSHDRYFLDKVTDHIFEFREGGEIKTFLGGYSDYLNQRTSTGTQEPAAKKTPPQKREPVFGGKLKFTFGEQREYEAIDGEIAALDTQLAQVKQDLITEASNFEKLPQLLELQTQLDAELAHKTERWFYLQELAERIAGQK